MCLPAGESTKSFRESREADNGALLALGLERKDMIIALGGGVIGDLTGFAAAVLASRHGFYPGADNACLRRWIAVSAARPESIQRTAKISLEPSTSRDLWSLIWMRWRPCQRRELRAGYAEVVKYGLIDDAPFFDWLQENGARVLAGESDALAHAVATSCQAKARDCRCG